MINFVDISLLKTKFGNLISDLYNNAHINVDLINNKFIFTPYFDQFENNNIDDFLKCSNEEIIYTLFNAKLLGNEQHVGPFYWSGIMYMNLFLNLGIPLNRLFVLCPLKTMVTHYEIFHEINDVEFINFFKEHYINVSLLKYLKESKGMTFKQLSILSGVKERTLLSYIDNNQLFVSNYDNIEILECIFDAPTTLFKKESSFMPLSYGFLNDTTFLSYLSKFIYRYYGIKNEDKPLKINNTELPTLEINEVITLKYKKRSIVINEQTFTYLAIQSLRQLKKDYSWDYLLF